MKSKVARILATALVFASGSVTAVQAQETSGLADARAEGLLVTTRATVESVNLDTRSVELRREDGELVTIDAGAEVRNLKQVKVGDLVEVDYYELMATVLEPSPTGVRERVESVERERAELGEKSAGTVTRTVEIVATVTAIDRKERLATLLGPERAMTVLVDEDVDLDSVTVGDDVRAIYKESIAIRVRSPEGR